jgi:hypothetical protein
MATPEDPPVAAVAGKRPLSLAIVGWLFIVMGLVGASWVLLPGLWGEPPAPAGSLLPPDGWYVLATDAVACTGGALLLARVELARWVLIGWLAVHVLWSVGGGTDKLVTHAVLFVVITWLLIRPTAAAWLRGVGRVAP